MSIASSFPDFMTDWTRLIKSIRNNQGSLPDLGELLLSLESILDEGKDLDAAKAAARAQLSQGAKRTRNLIPEGRAAASRLRAALKAHFGTHSEMLVEYGITPVRTRRLPQPADPTPTIPPTQEPGQK
jgi:hypothetical protein